MDKISMYKIVICRLLQILANRQIHVKRCVLHDGDTIRVSHYCNILYTNHQNYVFKAFSAR